MAECMKEMLDTGYKILDEWIDGLVDDGRKIAERINGMLE